MERNLLMMIIVFGVLAVVGLVLGLVLGLKDFDDEVLNSYSNTDELIQKFPVKHSTEVKDGIEKYIQNRLLTGFENWNRGFETWKAWGNILYTKDSIYNVHGARLTLEHYQEDMYETLGKMSIQMGQFNNMLIVGDFCAIYYDIIIGKNKGTTMEFVKFKNYGTTDNPDVRVVEGWGGVKDATYYNSIARQDSAEKQVQEEQNYFLLRYEPETSGATENKDKYFIKYKTENDADSDNILNCILDGFKAWNKGIDGFNNTADGYKKWVQDNFDENAKSLYGRSNRNRDQYIDAIFTLFNEKTITKLYFDNFLIRDKWAAIHYRYRSVDKTNTKVEIGDRMEFFQFNDDKTKIVNNWVK